MLFQSLIYDMEINWKKNAALFMTGQALSLFGSMLVQYAIIWYIVLNTQSGVMMTVFTVTGFLPMFLISPFGGVWADRHSRKLIINIADGAIAFASLVVAFLLLAGYNHFGILLICAAARSLGQGVHSPASGAYIPQIVPQEQLTRVNGIQGTINSVCTFAAPMLSGFLMTFTPLHIMFFLDVITASAGIGILIFFVKTPSRESAAESGTGKLNRTASRKPAYFGDLKEGLKYIRNHGFVLRIVVISALFSIFASPAALLTPLQTARNFGNDVWRLSAIEIAFSAGMALGGILIAVWGGFKNRSSTMALACLLTGLMAAGLGLSPHFWLYLIIMAGAGITMPVFNTPCIVTVQSTVEPEYMGRVFSVFTMTGSVMMPLGMLIFGPLSDSVNINFLLIGTGAAIALLGIPFMVSKVLHEAGKTRTEARQAQ